MKTVESKSESEGGQDTQIISENSKFLEQNVEPKRDDTINDLIARIVLLKFAHLATEGRLKTDNERLKTELVEKCELVDNLNQKHDALMSCTDELKLKVLELGREVNKKTEVTSLGLAEIAKRDEQINELNPQINLLNSSHTIKEDRWNNDTERLKKEVREKCEIIDNLNQKYHHELNTRINVLNSSHAAEKDRWNTDMERMKKGLKEKCELVNDLNQKHGTLMSCTNELKLKVVELERQVDKQREAMSLRLVEITKRDEQIKELKKQIDLLNSSHAIEEDRWNTDIERLKTEVREKCGIIEDLNQKYHNDTDELKAKVEELEREVEAISEQKREAIRQLSLTVEHYKSAYRQLRQVLVAINRMISLAEFLPGR